MTFLQHISPIYASIVVVLLPFIAFLFQAIRGKKSTSGLIGLLAIGLSTLISALLVFLPVWQHAAQATSISWFTIGKHNFQIGLLLNDLTVLMQLLVCVVALPVHIYSRAYMKGDPSIHRYWMYLSLFCFAMLGLTISNNLLMMYIFWELVGFASYLLIGFWFTKDSAVQANKKAFLINRIGDLGFLIGIAIIFTSYGTLDLVALFGDKGHLVNEIDKDSSLLTLAGICFFIGAMAKSAQFPLHVWLPDAMEGPTAVSSLIHAATMVAAGVFLLASIFPLFNATVLLIITIIGTITALTSAYFALAQYDIKKVLAFSTISQLGYMMVGIGIGAWDAAMFHLVTHAFFKCLLFLSAGAVIHEMAHQKSHTGLDFDPQDLRNMGGLRKLMPKTFIAMSIASLALAGFPLTAGYLSKDALVISSFEWAYAHEGFYYIIPIALIVISLLTAFYIGRLIFKAFFGASRIPADETGKIYIHEAPTTMLWPMYFLAFCSLFFVFSANPISYHDAPILKGFSVHYPFEEIHSAHSLIPAILLIGSLFSWYVGYQWYVKNKYPLCTENPWVKRARNQFGINAFYERTFVNGTLLGSKACYWFDKHIIDGIVNISGTIVRLLGTAAAWFDRFIVDGLVNTIAGTTYYLGHLLRWIQNGRLQNYLGFVFTVVLIGIIYLILR